MGLNNNKKGSRYYFKKQVIQNTKRRLITQFNVDGVNFSEKQLELLIDKSINLVINGIIFGFILGIIVGYFI